MFPDISTLTAFVQQWTSPQPVLVASQIAPPGAASETKVPSSREVLAHTLVVKLKELHTLLGRYLVAALTANTAWGEQVTPAPRSWEIVLFTEEERPVPIIWAWIFGKKAYTQIPRTTTAWKAIIGEARGHRMAIFVDTCTGTAYVQIGRHGLQYTELTTGYLRTLTNAELQRFLDNVERQCAHGRALLDDAENIRWKYPLHHEDPLRQYV